MLKSLLPVALVTATLVARAGDGLPAPAAPGASGCTAVNPSGGDIRVVTCRFPAGRPHRLTARFAGGHDDTSASLGAALDGEATSCDAGSKTSLFGEDGDVSLDCRVTAPGEAGSLHTLVVTVLWSHAQYRDVAFAAD